MGEIKQYDVAPHVGCELSMGLMAAMLEDATQEWRGEVPDVPDEAVVWQAFANGPSMGAVMWHMISVEAWWIEHVCAGKELDPRELEELRWKQTNVDEGQWPEAEPRPFTDYLATQDRVRARTLATIATLDEPERFVPWKGTHEFTIRWVLNHVVGHESYHGGQLVLLHSLWEKR